MTKHPIALAIALAFATSIALTGCDRISNLTDQEHIQRAKDFEAKGDLKAGIIELKNAIQKNPKNAQARWLLADIYIKKGLGAEAEKELTKARELGVGEESINIPLGQALLMQGKFKRVLEEISPSASTSQRNKAAILQMHGDAKLGLRQFEEGCQLYQDSLGVDPQHVPAYWGLANCAVAKRNLNEARARIDAAIKIDADNPESWVVFGDFERLSNNHQAAAEAYSTALKHDPGKSSALFGRAQVYAFIGKSAEAKADLEKLKKLAPNFFGIYFVEAALHLAAGKTDQALDSVQRALKSNSDYMPSQLLFAMVQYDRKAYEEAAKALAHYLERAPGHLEARKLLAAAYLKLGQPDRSLALLKPYIAAGKADAQVLALAGEAHLRSDDPTSAKVLFEKAADLVPTSATLRARVGLSQLAAGEEGEGVKELEKASRMNPKQAQADGVLVMTYMQLGQYDKALAAIDEMEKKQPNTALVHNMRGGAYLGKRDLANARKSFERALAVDSASMATAKNLAQLDLLDKKPDAARKRYQNVLAKDKNNIAAMLALADLAAAEKQGKEYLEWVEKAAKAEPKALEPKARQIGYHLGNKEPQKALALAREAQSANGDSPQTWDMLGRTQLAAGEKENAITSFTKVTQLAPDAPRGYLDLGAALASSERWQDARNAFSKALTLNPDYLDARRALVALELKQKRGAEALKLAEEQSRRQPKSQIGPNMEGDVLMAQKQFPQAAKAYERAFNLGKSSHIIIKLHQAMLQAGNGKDADVRLLAWLKERPEDIGARHYLADSLGARKDYKAAVSHYELALQKAPNNALILNNLAAAYGEIKDSRALATAEQAYKLQPKSAAVQDTLGWILLAQGQTTRALSLFKDAVASAPNATEVRYHYAEALVKSGDKVKAKQELDTLLKNTNHFSSRPAAESLRKQL